MLKTLRRASDNFIVKGFLLLIVLSFIVWGIGDMFRNSRGNAVISVGDREISVETYRNAINREKARMQNIIGKPLTDDQVAALQIYGVVGNQLITDQLLSLAAHDLGLNLSPKVAAAEAVRDPVFRNPQGQFDKDRFYSLLRSNGFTEKTYFSMIREGITTRFLGDAVSSVSFNSSALVDLLDSYRNEKRVVDVVKIPANVVASAAVEPTDAEIKTFFEKNQQRFATPEYRSASYVDITAENIGSAATDEASLKALYEERQDEFTKPESRKVLQMTFKDKDIADKALARLKQGDSFAKVAEEEAKMKASDVELGTMIREALPTEMADIIFGLAVNTPSDVVQAPFGWSIFEVSEILPAHTVSFEDAKEQLVKDATADHAEEGLYTLMSKIEDEIAAGATLKDIATNYDLKIQTLEDLTFDGKNQAGASPDIKDKAAILAVAFAGQEKEPSSPVELPENKGYRVVEVQKITPSRIKTIDEVRGAVIDGWKKEQHAKAYRETANAIAKELRNGATLADVSAKYSLVIETKKSLERPLDVGYRKNQHDLPDMVVQAAFAADAGHATDAFVTEKGEYVLAVVKEVIPSTGDTDEKASIAQDLENSTSNELYEQYTMFLRKLYPISVNEERMKQIHAPAAE